MARARGRASAPPPLRVANDNDPNAQIAPWPIVDRYPIVLGQGLSIAMISSAMRSATYGYRQNWVDILDELIEREPHGQAVIGQRILAVAGGNFEIAPAKTQVGTREREAAADLAKRVEGFIEGMEGLRRSFAALLWGLYYGISSAEIMWERTAGEWRPLRLNFVHPRRLSYPDPQTWDLHIWDQGPVLGWAMPGADARTNGIYGARLGDFPGKFIVHTPLVRGDYPTREGLGRILGFWFALKALAVRGGAQCVERFAKPWALAYFATQRTGEPRAATDDDIKKADAAVRALGIGSLSSATLPDSVKIVLERVEGGITHKEFLEICNSEISKCVLGQTLTTDVGASGSRAIAEIHKEGSREIYRFDAMSLSDDVERDLIRWIVRLNWPDELRLCPRFIAHVAEKPDPDALMNRAAKGASIGLPVDADELGARVGLPLVPADKPNARRLAPVTPMDASLLWSGRGAEPPKQDTPKSEGQ